MVPHTDWRGQMDLGTFPSGGVVGDGNSAGTYCRTPPGLSQACVIVDWPATYQGAFYDTRLPYGPNSWFGSLTFNQTDGSGRQYKRNRYYDPTTGRFTQQDPLGLAGGLNLYGFANGNPLNEDDPFGLCTGIRDCLRALWAIVKEYTSSPVFVATYAGTNAATTEIQSATADAVSDVSSSVDGEENVETVDMAVGAEAGEVATSFGAKIEAQLGKRGWTKAEVNSTIANADRTVATTDRRYLPDGTRMTDAATAYINKDGSYVVRNNKSGDIVQISNRNDPNWKSPF